MWREEVVGGGLDCGQGAARLGSYPRSPLPRLWAWAVTVQGGAQMHPEDTWAPQGVVPSSFFWPRVHCFSRKLFSANRDW